VRLEDTPGANVHSLEASSYDAWIKAYRPDENSVNSTVSYYLKGEIVCALLDLEIQKRTGGRVKLDDVVRYLYWERAARGEVVAEGELPTIFQHVAGVSLDDCFDAWVRGVAPLEVNAVLRSAGLALQRSARRDGPPVSLGVRLRSEAGRVWVESVHRGSAGHRAGLDARDEIISVAHRRVGDRLELPLQGLSPGDVVPVLIARDGWVRSLDVKLDSPALPEGKIVALADAPEPAQRIYEAWMGDSFANALTRSEKVKEQASS